jgi:hypothetical protein
VLAPVGDRLDEERRVVAARLPVWGLRVLAFALLFVYLVWNAIWLGQGRLSPALLLALTGVPAPTTGGVRSLAALAQGDWRSSLALNALALPMAALFLWCVARLGCCALRRERLALPRWVLPAWICVLSGAWVLKLAVA